MFLFRINKAILVGWLSKIITVIINFLSIKLLFNTVGVDGVAIQALLVSICGWFGVIFIGIPQTILNELTSAINKRQITNSKKNRYFTIYLNYVVLLVLISFLLTILINHGVIFNSIKNLKSFSLFLFIFSQSTLALNEIPNKILYAEGRIIFPNISNSIISILVFVVLYLCFNSKFINLSSSISTVFLMYSFPYLLVSIIYYLISFENCKLVNPLLMFKENFQELKSFFIFSIMSSFVLRIDYILLEKFSVLKYMAEYSVLSKIFMAGFFLYSLVLAILWPKFRTLYENGKQDEIVKILLRSILLGIFGVISFCSIILIFNGEIFKFISNNSILSLPSLTIILISIYYVIRICTDTFAVLAQSFGMTQYLVKITPIQAIISIIFGAILINYYNLNGLIVALIISYLLTVTWYLPLVILKNVKK
jgi:O-antigen/teichoic acid export membrane protein